MVEVYFRVEFNHVRTNKQWVRLLGDPQWPSQDIAEQEIARITAGETDEATLATLVTRIIKVTEEEVARG